MTKRDLSSLSRRNVSQMLLAGGVMLATVGLPNVTLAADGTALLKAAFDNWRSSSSKTEVSMTIHRPDWERTLSMKTYTRGDNASLVRFTAPAKDAGNATLQLDNKMWIFNPKLNQVVKLPASLLAQPWMGSDFSYSDLARTDDVLDYYTHRITGTESSGGKTVHVIEATPKPGAPVVWGKQVVKVRSDGIMMEVTYYDQDMRPVKHMKTDRIRNLGGRAFPAVMTMQSGGSGGWTRIETTAAQFDLPLPDYLFTKSNLSNPRE